MPNRLRHKQLHVRGSPNHETQWPCHGCGQIDGRKGRSGVECDSCKEWWHSSCAGIHVGPRTRRIQWNCPRCLAPPRLHTLPPLQLANPQQANPVPTRPSSVEPLVLHFTNFVKTGRPRPPSSNPRQQGHRL